MARLTQADTRALLHCLQAQASLTDLAGLPERLLASLQPLVAATSICFNEVDPEAGRFRSISAPVLPVLPDEEAIMARHQAEHPLLRYHLETGDGSAVQFADFLGQRAFHRLALYALLYRPLDVEQQIAFTLPSPTRAIVALSFDRDRQPYTERERLLLNLVRPHLAQTYQNAVAVTRLQATLSPLNGELVTLDRRGHPRTARDRARRWLEIYGVPDRAPSDALPEPFRSWVLARRAALRRDDGVPRPGSALVIERGERAIRARYVPSVAPGLPDTIILEERSLALAPHTLRRFGLTRRESQVLLEAARGAADTEIAAVLALAVGTVRKHLEHIYRKLDVETRTAAVARAHRTHLLADVGG